MKYRILEISAGKLEDAISNGTIGGRAALQMDHDTAEDAIRAIQEHARYGYACIVVIVP